MDKSANPTEAFIKALSDNTVQKLIGDIFEQRLKSALLEIEHLKKESADQRETISRLAENLSSAYRKINDLESYTRRDNLIISGLPLASYSEAATAMEAGTQHSSEHTEATEQSVLTLCQQLQVNITPADISVAHRLKKKSSAKAKGPPAVIVRFTNRKARDAVYAARFKLKERKDLAIYVNEDLTKNAAEIFAETRRQVKNQKLHSTWTKSGVVYIKATQSSHPIGVHSINEITS